MKELFHRVASKVSIAAGTPTAFLGAIAIVLTWACTGPLFGFSDTWQLVINTGTTIVTFLMVFLIQNTQNRDAKAVHLKLDELIHSTKGARNSFVSLENISDDELEELDKYFRALRARQDTSPGSLNKLHQNIAAEHNRRLSLKGATQALSNILRAPMSMPRFPGQGPVAGSETKPESIKTPTKNIAETDNPQHGKW